MVSLEEAQGDVKKGCKYLMGENEEESSRPFSVELVVRTRGNGCRLERSKFNLDTRKHLSIVRMAQHWNGLTRQVVKSPPSGTCSVATCCSKLCFSRGVRQGSPCSPEYVQLEHICEWLLYIYNIYNHVHVFIHVCVCMKSAGEQWRYFLYSCFSIVCC